MVENQILECTMMEFAFAECHSSTLMPYPIDGLASKGAPL
jgi:hypothetical protein